MKSYHIQCPKCNNDHSFYRYGKDPDGYQKYLCQTCQHQFAPDRPRSEGANCRRKHPPCLVCGKASFLHHDYEHYSNYRCTDKKCNYSFFVWKSAAVTAPSMSNLFGKHDFKRMRYSALNGLPRSGRRFEFIKTKKTGVFARCVKLSYDFVSCLSIFTLRCRI